MKRFILAFLIALIGSSFFTVPGSAQQSDFHGLWVGTATLKYVSEVNKQYPDLSFDLGLVGVKDDEGIIPPGDTWDYNDSGTDPGSTWMDSGNGAGWQSSHPAPFGFGYDPGDIATRLTQQATVYFRKHFDVADPSLYSGLRVKVWRDDGVVLYLNGEEILRNNLPKRSGFDTHALSEIGANTAVEFTLSAALLEVGENVLAAEVHTASEEDDDLLFDLELTANSTTELIALEAAAWKYHDSEWGPGANSEADPIDANWHSDNYDDSGWATGRGQFGYGEGDEAQTVSESAPAVYFRKTFSGNSADFTDLRVLLLSDDGAVVYLNGTEILRSNMPDGAIEHGTPPVKALGSIDEGRYLVVDVDIPVLPGTNVLAVEVHQHPAELEGSSGSSELALTRTSAPLDLRLLFHVDDQGQVRLLKEVIQMSKPNPQPGEDPYVLLTDHSLVSNYTGVAIRDGVPVGRRLSAVGFDFDGLYVSCNTGFSADGTVNCDPITLIPNHPTNPFLHRYYPDHDNLDERYEDPVEEAFQVTRNIELEFDTRYPPDEDLPVRAVAPAGWGFDLLGGYYEETLIGLYRNITNDQGESTPGEIKVRGPFILRRVATTAALTPE